MAKATSESYLYSKIRTDSGPMAKAICTLCGDEFTLAMARVELFADQNEGDIFVFGDVCPRCVDAGPSGAANRVRERSRRLKREAFHLDEIAELLDEVDAGRWSTLEELARSELRIASYFQGIPDEQRDDWIAERVADRMEFLGEDEIPF